MANVFSFRYSTKYFDSETGFYYYGRRFYSPELNRWITRDPIGEEGGVNLYCFCGNNAVSKVDPVGHAVFFVLAGLDNNQNSFSNLKTQMADAIRVAMKSLTFLNSLTVKHYECLKRKNAVFFNGKNYYGTFDEYKNLLRHELKSCIKIRGDFRGSVLAVKSLAMQMDKSWDCLAYVAHGGDGRKYKVRTILSFSDGIYNQHEALEYVSNNMTFRNGTKLVVSCYQTWNGQGGRPLHPETIRIVPPRFKYCPSGNKPMLDYTTHRVKKGVK